ncbi:MAG: hypothetical protein IJ491_09220 [Clostridia bacterium]|nr:hypothetical protein [Clostridia bacterium]
MTELEKIAYAKSFIDKLANGISPLDDTSIKEDDIVNNIRLSRCFFFVSDILRQVIENGGIKQKKNKRSKFELSEEQLSKFAYSDLPIPISEIAKRLNLLITDETMKKISHRDLTNWLISIGLLKEISSLDGKTAKRPTEQGEAMGILTEQRTGQQGTYTVVIYDRAAQSFIIDNLDAVIALKYNK